ncbi:putative BET2-geranylgeranyltransferase type II beta subunit [Microstroma glucosiphilum]|uniref:Geranylgeranyl transferase type-2 subunit beta n=1 Tax=Pseudomicrostroma glucosiphilum TaxID=1684307 RepID=A0A316UBR2_9BASI|nr:putative BET2-geranylgeranyltransferase type II beta subunit [Pseudomicrostroma glucosiphilum]PWN22298.1 putative BET2-geranylgeranyltransferase type II beta subunit [Pseudomicrostroma glucosiphilum]
MDQIRVGLPEVILLKWQISIAYTQKTTFQSNIAHHLSTLLIPLHVKHILRLSSNTTSLAYHLSTHLRINGVYWGLMALELMGRGEELKEDELVDFVMSCWDKESGGFGSFPKHDAHLLSTCSAIQILVIKDRLEAVDKKKVADFVLSLQNPTSNLFFGDSSQLEEDSRFSYCATLTLSLLGALHRLDRTRTIAGIIACSNFDGGFGWVEGSESHAGGAFVCVASLAILDALPPRQGEGEGDAALSSWLSERQLPNGGLNGRPQKLEDVCYSWWVLSALSILGRLHWIDAGKLVKFILSAQDPDSGGIADRPDNVSDVFHTFFGLAGLSLLGFRGLGSPQETQGRRVDPIYALPERTVDRLNIHRPYQRL